MNRARGSTLLELAIVMAIIAIAAVVSAPLLARRRANDSGLDAELKTARAEALATGAAATRVIFVDERLVVLTALPDGRVLGDSLLSVDPFSGVIHAP